MYTEFTVPCRPLPELRQAITSFLKLLCAEGESVQRTNKLRPQTLNMRALQPRAWVRQHLLPTQWRRDDVSVFCLYEHLPCLGHPNGEWVLIGGVERVVLCTCGKNTICEHAAESVDEDDPTAVPGCGQCCYRVTFYASPRLPFEQSELLAAFDHYLCHDAHHTSAASAPWPLDLQRDGFALLEQSTATEPEANASAGRTRLNSSIQLEQWMRSVPDPQNFGQFFDAWLQLRRQEPGFAELIEIDKVFERAAKRCLARIFGEGHS